MSKKFAVFMAGVCVGLIALVGWFRLNGDRTGPEVTCNNTSLVYHEGMKDSELLENVIAFDEKDGDVTDSLTVESVYAVDKDEVCIVYVAKDNSNNITKVKQTYPAEQTAGNEQEEAAANESEETDSNTEGADTEEQDVSNSSDEEQNGDSASDTVEEPTSADMGTDTSFEAEQARTEQEAAAAAMPAQNPRIYLTDYVVTVPAGTSVDRLSYVKEITDDTDNVYDLWTKIQITGSLDTLTPGTYECTYYVIDSAGNTSNQAVLKFIVE